MKIALIISLIISLLVNMIAISKWIFWSRGFMGAFYLYQKKYGILSENELRILMKKAIDCGIENTINDLTNKF